jgi:hypothetical protein
VCPSARDPRNLKEDKTRRNIKTFNIRRAPRDVGDAHARFAGSAS